ncbi:cysteine dioxygenase family protein [Actinocrispum sp. NPDC049592]|uniref:cysteine dioxygenase n=1 Tax=Actinocrispum sp. NPDC049592 TaxID=3154835 RepID=UPI003420E04A
MTASLTDVEVHPDLPELSPLLHPSRLLWTPSELSDLTARVATTFASSLHSIVRYTTPDRWWARLALTEGVELWLLSWTPGQQTEPHDHGGASGSFTVLTGELAEFYRYPGGPIRSQSHARGSALGFGAGRAHQVLNLSRANAASVHAYSPPLVATREYGSLAEIPAEIPPLPAHRSLAELRKEPVEP